MATDYFYYGTSAFTFWAELGLGNFQLKCLPVKLHRASARGGSPGSPWAQAAGPVAGGCPGHRCAAALSSTGTQRPLCSPRALRLPRHSPGQGARPATHCPELQRRGGAAPSAPPSQRARWPGMQGSPSSPPSLGTADPISPSSNPTRPSILPLWGAGFGTSAPLHTHLH